jgi:formylmethanofuran dehydrogenase subunit E
MEAPVRWAYMSEEDTQPCEECGEKTPREELDDNEEQFGERICNNCAEAYEAEADLQDMEDE